VLNDKERTTPIRLAGAFLGIFVVVLASSADARGPWRANENNVPGWYFMSPEERIEHQSNIRGLKSFEECVEFRQRHHELLAERARAQGRNLGGGGRRNYCEQLFPREARP